MLSSLAAASILLPSLATSARGQDGALALSRTAVVDVEPAGTMFEVPLDHAGLLYVWARPVDAGPLVLRILDENIVELVVADGRDDERTCAAWVPARAGGVLLVELLLPEREAVAQVEVHLEAAEETLETLAWAGRAQQETAEIAALRQGREFAVARPRAERLASELEMLPGASRSQAVRAASWGLAQECDLLGAFQVAVRLWTRARDFDERVLPQDHGFLRASRTGLARALTFVERYSEAAEIYRGMLTALRPTHPDDQLALRSTRIDLGGALYQLGRPVEARDLLEDVLATFPADTPENDVVYLRALHNLGATLRELGDLAGGRDIEERVYAVRCRELPADDPDLQDARINFASTLFFSGDLPRAKELFEIADAELSRTQAPDAPALQLVRGNLAITMKYLGDLQGALKIEEEAVVILERMGDEASLNLGNTRLNLATTLLALGAHERALGLLESVVATFEQALEPGHADLLRARHNLALALYAVGERERALAVLEATLTEYASGRPEDHFELLAVRSEVAFGRARRADRQSVVAQLQALARAATRSLREAALTASPRECGARAASLAPQASSVLSLAADPSLGASRSDSEAKAFTLVESLRCAELLGPLVAARVALDPELERLRADCALAARELTRLFTAEVTRAKMHAALEQRERAWRAFVDRLIEIDQASAAWVEPSPEWLCAHVAPQGAMIGYWVYDRHLLAREDPAIDGRSEPSLLAWVLRPGRPLARVELGALAPLDEAVRRWREALRTARSRIERPAGEALRELMFDPLRAHLDGVARVQVALAGPLHGIPLDALPIAGEGDSRLGDELAIELHSSLWELTLPARAHEPDHALVVFGGIDFDQVRPAERSDVMGVASATVGGSTLRGAANSVLRAGGFGQGFGALPWTASEAQETEAAFRKTHGEAPTHLFLGSEASRDALVEHASRAQFLHLATHGWISAEALASSGDDSAGSARPGALALERGASIRGMAPMLLCGVALAGANIAPDPRQLWVPGVLTAEDVAALDLSGCELAVLSACDTGMGIARAGLGLASLQRALHMAGARYTLTSLWTVPDAPTRNLMRAFYRHLWEEEQSPREALWCAKTELRRACDELGRPLHSPPDWAGWVLTGE